MAVLTMPAQMTALTAGITFVTQCATAAGVATQRLDAVVLAVEEALTNICHYAYGEGAGEIEIHCAQASPSRLCIELIDTGAPFNILALPPPDLTSDIEQRPVGGLGIHLIRTMMDEVAYRREGPRNILQLIVYL